MSTDIGQGLGAGLGTFAIFFGFFARGGFLFSLEFLDSAELIDEAHLTGKEGVALGADIDGHGIASGASLERRPARAGDRDLMVLWVDV